MGVFFVFYKLLLEKENMHAFKRFYLLFTLVFSLMIPSIVFMEYVPVDAVEYNEVVVSEVVVSEVAPSDSVGVPEALEEDVLDIEPVLWTIYSIGLLYFGIIFMRNLIQVIRRIRKNPKQKVARFVKVLLHEELPPHTFFKYIFLNQKKVENNQIPKEVLLHEQTHAQQKHSYDVIFIELFQVLFWFNPMVYLFKNAMKLNHEFLADEAVLKKDIDRPSYQNTLLSYLSVDSQHKYQSRMANAINYSSIKKRFTIMKTQTSKRAKFLRIVLTLPVAVLLLLGFSETRKVIAPIAQFAEEIQDAQQEPTLDIIIDQGEIMLYGEKIPLNKFATKIDELTEDWEETDYTSFHSNVSIKNTDAKRLGNINDEFLKTHLSKANGGLTLVPPPPSPPSPITGSDVPESPEAIAPVPVENEVGTPPAPPEPEDPLDHVIAMAKRGAEFYFEGNAISADKAIELLKKNKNLHIQTTKVNSSKPKVKLSETPITFPKKTKKVKSKNSGVRTGTKKVDGKVLFFSKKDGVTHYYAENGAIVDGSGKPVTGTDSEKPVFYYNGEKISPLKANTLLSNNTSLQVTSQELDEKGYAVILTDLNNQDANNKNNTGTKDPFIDITEAVKKGSKFFLNDKPITTEEAIALTQKNSIHRVQVKDLKDGVQAVYFWD
ncbi:MAG: M56 family metallopeptidase [Bacteroidota bacterium]